MYSAWFWRAFWAFQSCFLWWFMKGCWVFLQAGFWGANDWSSRLWLLWRCSRNSHRRRVVERCGRVASISEPKFTSISIRTFDGRVVGVDVHHLEPEHPILGYYRYQSPDWPTGRQKSYMVQIEVAFHGIQRPRGIYIYMIAGSCDE